MLGEDKFRIIVTKKLIGRHKKPQFKTAVFVFIIHSIRQAF